MAYQVFDYSIETLKNCFSNQAQAHEAIIHSKQHLVCFERYFEHINVKTIILEENYISRDFLEDYSTYYVRSFKDYKKTCVRLHFFNIRITESDFTKILDIPETFGESSSAYIPPFLTSPFLSYE